ncbi:MAG: tetratricopeptide repeat protein [Myxococcales bacterium]|nr:tetratricopeptide repeat protein [Myxococcales bacterium]
MDARTQSCPPWLVATLLALLAALLWPTTTLGQARRGKAPPEALEHYERSRELFTEGEYEDAVDELEAALELDPGSPNLLYNAAYASELSGDLEQALEYYAQYEQSLGKHERRERRKTRKTMERLRARVDVQDGRSGRDDGLFWVVLGGGVGLLSAGAVTGGLATEEQGEARDGLTTATQVLLISGSGAVAGAALLYLLRPANDPTDAQAPLAPPPVSAGSDGRSLVLTVRGHF